MVRTKMELKYKVYGGTNIGFLFIDIYDYEF